MKFAVGSRVTCVDPDCDCGGLVGVVLETDPDDDLLPYFVHFVKLDGDDDSGWMAEDWLEATE